MLFHVHMTVNIPHDADPETVERRKKEEKERSQQLQRDGIWLHLWRVAGQYANISVFDVSSPAELHEILSTLPLYPYMDVTVTALTSHPSALA